MSSSVENEYGGLEDQDTMPPPITLDQMKDRIRSENNIALCDDDPLLVQYTMHVLFIENMQQQLDHFSKQTAAIIQNTGAMTANAVSECLQVLKDETLDSALKQTLAQYTEEIKQFLAVEESIKSLRRTLVILTTLCWVALFVNFLLFIRS